MNKIAVHLFLYHLDLFDNFLSVLSPFRNEITLYLSLCKDNGSQADIITTIKKYFNAKISFHDNYGADIAPFLNTIESIKEPYFIKLHSKKSMLGQYHQIDWRNVLIHNFFGNKNLFNYNSTVIKNNFFCGAVGNMCLLYTDYELYHKNKILTLCDILNIDYNKINNYSFFGGSMFLSETKLFQKHFLPYNAIIQNLLSQETQKVNEIPEGTYSHSLERIFGYIIPYNHKQFCYTRHRHIIIQNNNAPYSKFRMIVLHNNDCYLQEDINVYGTIINDSIDTLTIQWKHIEPNQLQKYSFVNPYTITKII